MNSSAQIHYLATTERSTLVEARRPTTRPSKASLYFGVVCVVLSVLVPIATFIGPGF